MTSLFWHDRSRLSMGTPPRGTVTFLFAEVDTDEDGTWSAAELATAIDAHGGYPLELTASTVWAAAFASARDAISTALDFQLGLAPEQPRVRMALHTGDVELREDRYDGTPLQRCARLLAIANADQTLLSGVCASLVRDALPPGAQLRDLGLHRLKDLAEPERVFQLLHTDLSDEAPALRSLDAVQHNLPIQLTSFVAREAELNELQSLLLDQRLITLTGTAGAGKTRLALQIAAQVVDRFPDGVWWVELAAISDEALVERAVAEVLRVREEADRPLSSTLEDYLRSKQVLLLLDNCEHVLHAVARLISALLDACPGVSITATSRAALGLRGERAYRVASLPVPERTRGDTLGSVAQYAAARLFIERATAARPEFKLTDSNAPALAQVCWRLDGIPLAIELAAARVRVLSVEQIADRLDDVFRLLVSADRIAQPRQHTLRAAVDWSYALLSQAERTFFAQISVFAGGWSLEAAEAICTGAGFGREDVLDLLQQLVDKSLLTAHEVDGTLRYRLLETLREYATAKLRESDQLEQTRNRHAQWYLALAEDVEPLLFGVDQGKWLSVLELEHENFRAALRWLIESNQAEPALRLAGALWRFWEAHAHFAEGRRMLRQVLEDVPQDSSAAHARALAGAGMLASRQGDFVEAVRFLDASLSAYGRLGDRQGMAFALTYLAVQAQEQGEAARATALHMRSIELYESLGADRHGLARSLNNLGYHLLLQGDNLQAAPYLERGLAIGRELGDGRLIAVVLYNLGWVAEEQREGTRARSLYEEALALFRQAGDTRWIAFSLLRLGGLAHFAGDLDRAFELTAEGLSLFREVGEKSGLTLCLEQLAEMAITIGDASRAAYLFGVTELMRERQHYPLHSGELAERQHWVARGKSLVSSSTWLVAWRSGRTASLENAIETALAAPVATDSVTLPLHGGAALSRREHQVAELVARGLTNREIAEALVIGGRTVDAHVDHIRAKLGVRSRAAIASWVVSLTSRRL